MRYILGLVLSMVVYAAEITPPQFKETFMENAFLRTSNAGLGSALTCEIGAYKKVKANYNAKAESKALFNCGFYYENTHNVYKRSGENTSYQRACDIGKRFYTC